MCELKALWMQKMLLSMAGDLSVRSKALLLTPLATMAIRGAIPVSPVSVVVLLLLHTLKAYSYATVLV